MEIPRFASEDKERNFWATHDSVGFLGGAEQVNLKYEGKDITGTNSKTILCSRTIPIIEEKDD